MHRDTRVIRAGRPHPTPGAPFLPGPTFASAYHAPGDPAQAPFTYARFHNPTWTLFEAALGDLEGGHALVFASGQAASAAILGTTLRPGDTVLLPSDSYFTTRLLGGGYFSDMGVKVRLAPTLALGSEALDGITLLWIETPTNPGLEVCDVGALVTRARDKGTLVAVDNTTATAFGQQPLALGADFSFASDTKALTGHSDLILGHVAVRDPAWHDTLKTWRTQMGAIAGPMEVWLAHRSLATLGVRLERQAQSALALAEYLSTRVDVAGLRYPGLPGDASYAVATRQMTFFGPVVSFVLESRERAERFLAACTLVDEATSFGGVHTTAERRARWGGDAIPDGFIRLSVGCEHPADLVADVTRALDASRA